MELLIQRQQSILAELRHETLHVKQFAQFFDDVIAFLHRNIINRVDCYRLLTTICFDFNGLHHLGLFNRRKILQHPFFPLLSRTFEMLFTKLNHLWLSSVERECLNAISLFISHLCSHKNEMTKNFYIANNEYFNPETRRKSAWISYEETFFTKTFRSKFVSMLRDDLSANRLDANDDLKYQLANRFLRLWMKLKSTDYQFVFDAMVRCLRTELYSELARDVDLRRPSLSPQQQFFLYQCPKFLQKMFRDRQKNIADLLCEHLVSQSMDIFNKQLPIACEGESVPKKGQPRDDRGNSRGAKLQFISWYIELLNSFALVESSRVQFVAPLFKDLHSLHDHTTMVDQMLQIIQTKTLVDSVMVNRSFYHADVSLVAYALILLYNLVFEQKIWRYLREKNLFKTVKMDAEVKKKTKKEKKESSGILDELAEAKDRTIQFTATTLIAILQKEKIDEVRHPTTIARSYLFMIENTIDELSHTFHGIKLEGVLTNLEAIVQSDEVKEEIVNDDGFVLLGECSYRTDLDWEKIRYPALRIIDTLSFAESAPEKLKENERLMDYLDDLSRSSDQGPAAISKRTIWIANNELKPIAEEERKEEEKRVEKIDDRKVEKKWDEKKAIYQYVPGDYQFRLDKRAAVKKSDIVITYTQADETMALKIQEQLKSSRNDDIVLLEANKTDPEEMALMMSKAHLVLICYSNEYQRSNGSRLHATFARMRDKARIGLKVDRIFHQNAWLTEILGGTTTIDFTKSDFHHSMDELDRLIKDFKR